MSNFNILAVLDGDAVADPLYPTPGEQPDSVEPVAQDGQCLPPITAGELVVREVLPGGNTKRLVRVHDIKAKVVVSQARVTVACSKYDKGGGWKPWTLAAIPVAVTANAVSKVRASRRRHGKMLVGHLRYQDLLSVGYKARSTALGHDQLRLGMKDPTARSFRGLALDITLPRQQSGSELAQRIAGLAATHRLNNSSDALSGSDRERLGKLQKPSPLQSVPKRFVSYLIDAALDSA